MPDDQKTKPAKTELTDHHINDCNQQIKLVRIEPPEETAHRRTQYEVTLPGQAPLMLKFQDGEVDKGVNGLTNEVLLVILLDRVRAEQAGPFRSQENQMTLASLENAGLWFKRRATERKARGVEGTHKA